ncbi:MAG TPA: leucyl/phenylalanyl-tRNA--protein transferase [Woeseiaceae bacterium]|nr:leucyl/phenylalanyl-tRNA--protein transferase [Woeseiaceae bacterium]
MTRGRVTWLAPTDAPQAFPDVSRALREPDGLLAAGGDLSSERLIEAYRRGIFPWYEQGQPILWWSPDPRCILWPADLHISRRLRKEIRSTSLTVRYNQAFADVIRACAGPRRYQSGTWITPDMMAAFERLHGEGWAHSVEIWDRQRLVGGLYGLAVGKAFFGESMFSSTPNASKLALLALTRHMLARGIEILDCQVVSPHLDTLGATTMPRGEFAALLDNICASPVQLTDWPPDAHAVAELLRQ